MEGIAVIGLAGRFPHAENAAQYWDNLCAGRECLEELTEDDILAAGVPRRSLSEERVRSRGILQDADCFDASFFGYSPREAEIMDPQQRVFLELAWEALEDAGYDTERTPESVGVFAGVGINTYFQNNVRARPDILDTFGMFPATVLNEKDFVATRVAYKMNLRGPAVTVQTACSTSLVAVCNACQSLLSYECDVALAGASAAVFPQCHSFIHEEGGMIAPDGHCRPFDARAGGTLFSDGAGIVVLKRLDDAIAAGDNVLAVIKGFAVNNDGTDKAGFSAPSVNGQAEVIRMAQELAGFSPDSISYVEAHGTATPLGDPIEVAALTEAFRNGTERTQFCGIGSVKSNIGHLDVAAGVAGLIKTVLALKHETLPPTLHFEKPNPEIDFENSPFYVVDRLSKWKRTDAPRRAGVSSFGIGGTNAHVVLEEAPERPATQPDPRGRHLFVWSAKTQESLDASTSNLASYLQSAGAVNLADVAYTLQTGRRELAQRRAIVCRDAADAVAALEDPSSRRVSTGTADAAGAGVVFLFPGQGSQRVGMGRELYEHEPIFRETLDGCAEVLRNKIGLDLRDLLYPEPQKEQWAEDRLVQTRYTQPALFAVEYSLAQLWRNYGVEPAAMIGHSVGEYVAACLAGVFSLEDALQVIAERGRLIQQLPGGSMLAVLAAAADVAPRLGGALSLAAVNGPALCVVAGPDEEIATLEADLGARGLTTRRLRTSHAFHSSMMDPALEPLEEVLQAIPLHQPKIPFISNVTGAWADGDEVTKPGYWVRHVRQAVRFADGADELLREKQIFLEVGPGATLSTLMRQQQGSLSARVVAGSLPARSNAASEIEAVFEAAGRLWVNGVSLDWEGFHAGRERRRTSLPTYAFERKRYFIQPKPLEDADKKRSDKVLTIPSRLSAERGEKQPVAKPAAPSIDVLRTKLVDLSGLPANLLGDCTPFVDLGLDSLQLAQFCRVIETAFGIRIEPKHFAGDRACLRSIADRLVESSSDRRRSEASSAAPSRAELEDIRDQLRELTVRVEELSAAAGPSSAPGSGGRRVSQG